MEVKHDDEGVEFVSTGWDVEYSNTGNSKIFVDPFDDGRDTEEPVNTDEHDEPVKPASTESATAEDTNDEPLLEKDVDDGGEGTEDEPSSETENPVFFIAKQAIADGYLPPDFDVTEEVSLPDLYQEFIKRAEPVATEKALREAELKLQNAGIKDENISLLQAIENDVPIDEVYEVSKYKKYSSLSEDTEDTEKIKVIKDWYSKRGLSEKEQQRNLDAIDLNDELDSEFSTAKNFFAKVVSDFDTEQSRIRLEKQAAEEEIRRVNSLVLNKLEVSNSLGEEKLSKADADLVIASLKNKEAVKFGNDVYNLTPYEQFFLALNNNFEFSLQVFKDFLLKDKKAEKIKNEVREEVEQDWISAYSKSQKKSTSSKSHKRDESTEEKPKTGYTKTGGVYHEF